MSDKIQWVKPNIIKNALVRYSNHTEDWYSQAELFMDGNYLRLPDKHFKTLAEAVADLQNRICEAIVKYDL